jgi:hypothetical protein
LIITEVVNMFLHGIGSPVSIAFNLGGTIVNAAVIYGVYPTAGVLRKPLKRWTLKITQQLDADSWEVDQGS